MFLHKSQAVKKVWIHHLCKMAFSCCTSGANKSLGPDAFKWWYIGIGMYSTVWQQLFILSLLEEHTVKADMPTAWLVYANQKY